MFRLSPIERRSVPDHVISELSAVCPIQTADFGDLVHDESGAGDYAPHVAVFPRSTAEVAAIMRIASAHGAPVTVRGGGSGKSGGCLAVAGGILLCTRALTGIVELSSADNLAVVRPGLVLADLQKAAVDAKRLYPPDPASADWCTVGGTVAENAAGPRAFKYGVTRDYVLGLEAVLASGEIVRTGRRTSKGVAGYDLTSLLCGSEGSLAVITEVTVELVPHPSAVATAWMAFDSVAEASAAVTRIIDAGEQPACLELLDQEACKAIGRGEGAVVIVELDGEGELLDRLDRVATIAQPIDCQVAMDEQQRKRMWDERKSVSQALKKRYARKVSEDIVVPRSRIPQMIEKVREICEPRGFSYATYGHAGDGNLHTNILWNDAREPDEVLALVYEAAVSLGGTITGEHGVGLVKREFLSIEQPQALIALQRRLKAVFDPAGILNPHKLFPEERHAHLGR